MGIELFGLLEVLLFALALLCRAEVSAIIMACLTMFIATTAISIASLTVNPAVLFVPFYALMAVVKSKPEAEMSASAINGGGFYLLLFIAHAALVTVLTPMFFNGEIEVNWPSADAAASRFSLLHPGSIGNITQFGYALVAVACYFATYRIFRAKHSALAVVNMLLWVAALNIIFSVVDNVTYYTGTKEILHFIRNSNYAMLDSDTVVGIKRTVGTFTEASFYAGYTLALFAALLALYAQNIHRILVVPLLLGTSFFLLLSLSTTAYVGLTLYVVRLVGPSVITLFTKGKINKTAAFGLALVIAIALAIVLSYVMSGGIAIIDDLIFKKAESESGADRAILNGIAWEGFVHSFGLGIGIGSTRAASFVLVLLSNTGIIGFVLYLLFLKNSFTLQPKASAVTRGVIIACREAAIACFIAASLGAPVFDIGLLIYILTGAGSALSASHAKIAKTNLLDRGLGVSE